MSAKKNKVTVTIQENNLGTSTINEMWQLYQKYYFCDYDTFIERLETVKYVSFYKKANRIVGFIGIEVVRQHLHGRNYLLMRFGQVIIDKAFRGKSLIPITGAKLCRLFWKDFLFGHTYFWADTLTYKSYLVFAKTLEEFYPSYKQPTPYQVKDVIDFIGTNRYGGNYNSALGTVCKSFKFVNDFTTEVQAKYREDKDIQFFANVNARHREGHGLITIAPASFRNLLQLAKRYVQKYMSLTRWIQRRQKRDNQNGQLIID